MQRRHDGTLRAAMLDLDSGSSFTAGVHEAHSAAIGSGEGRSERRARSRHVADSLTMKVEDPLPH